MKKVYNIHKPYIEHKKLLVDQKLCKLTKYISRVPNQVIFVSKDNKVLQILLLKDWESTTVRC